MRPTRTPLTMQDHVDIQNGIEDNDIKINIIISDTSAHIMRRTRTPLTMHDSHHHVDIQNGVEDNDVMTKIIISVQIMRRTKTPTLILMRLMMLIIMMILMFMMIRIMATVIK